MAAPKQELSIKITDINRIHVDDMNILESGEREVRQDFAPQAAGANDEDLALVAQKVLHLPSSTHKKDTSEMALEGVCILAAYAFPSHKRGICSGTWSVEDLIDMVVPIRPIAQCRVSIDLHIGSGSHALC